MSKYKSVKVEYNGQKFDSKKELARYLQLLQYQQDGRISNLQRQVEYQLIPNQRKDGKVVERAIKYVADFEYFDEVSNEKVVEDVKGYRAGGAYAVFKIKKKLMLWIHGITVTEV